MTKWDRPPGLSFPNAGEIASDRPGGLSHIAASRKRSRRLSLNPENASGRPGPEGTPNRPDPEGTPANLPHKIVAAREERDG
jgi:hypothetical protein